MAFESRQLQLRGPLVQWIAGAGDLTDLTRREREPSAGGRQRSAAHHLNLRALSGQSGGPELCWACGEVLWSVTCDCQVGPSALAGGKGGID